MPESEVRDVDRAGIIVKKCDLALHKPDTNKACAAGACQHTCQAPTSARTPGRRMKRSA